MKQFRTTLASLLFLVVAVGCSKPPSKADSEVQTPRPTEDTSLHTSAQPVNISHPPSRDTVTKREPKDEALEISKKAFFTHWTQRGDSLVSYNSVRGFTEIKKYSFVVYSENLTESDALNGVEWKGEVTIDSKVYREGDATQWTEWFNGLPLAASVVTLSKVNGKWNVHDSTDGEAPPLNSIPK